MGWFIVSLSGKEQKGQTVGIHEVNYNWCHSTFPMVRVFRHIYWHISLDHCLVLLLPMQKTGLSQEYRQSSRTRCQVFCKVQSTHQGVALIPDLESDRVWSCCHQQIWLQADLPRTSWSVENNVTWLRVESPSFLANLLLSVDGKRDI